jgi:HSP20 family protein
MTDKKATKVPPTRMEGDGGDLAVWSGTGLASVFEDLFRPFEEFFKPLMQGSNSPTSELRSSRQPILDVQDRGDHYSVTAELPGFTKDEVEVKVGSNGIELKAEKEEKQGKSENGTYQRSSRSYYQYISLPEEVVSEKIDGTMKNGILQLKLPKRASKLKDNARRVDLK